MRAQIKNEVNEYVTIHARGLTCPVEIALQKRRSLFITHGDAQPNASIMARNGMRYVGVGRIPPLSLTREVHNSPFIKNLRCVRIINSWSYPSEGTMR